MATATTSSTATGPTATYAYTEFGATESGTPGSYGWLGADQISDNALGGQLLMGARAYNANTGRFSQVDPIPGGSANSYDYTTQNPLTDTDLSGEWSEYCDSNRSFRSCNIYYTHYEATKMALELQLDAIGVGCFAALIAIAGGPVVGAVLAFFGGALYALSDLISYYNGSQGFYFHIDYWRATWWFFGWHYGGWIPYWISFGRR